MLLVDHRSAIIETQHLRFLSAALRVDSGRACSRASGALEHLRDTLLRYGLRRTHRVRGGSDDGVEMDGRETRRRVLINTIVAHYPMPVRFGPSVGTTCMLCLGAITLGARQFDIRLGQATIILDDDCYITSMREVVQTQSNHSHP